MPVLELDTASLTRPERFGAWAETITTAFGPFGISRNDPDRFHGRVRVERRHAIRFIELGYGGHAFRRSRRDVARLDELQRAGVVLRSPGSAGPQIATIAYRLGFSDPAHFTRAFRRHFGASPSEWRSDASG